ncbi:MAG: DNA repair protein RadC [Endomicrobiaceae bacterium]|nr:DNA repair protein RadC [Endomicrobiaceae bacterium]
METCEQKRFMLKDNDVSGHRQRVKERFLKTGFDNWQDYEILEFALFFVIPRKDTKQTAKDLIKKFGSLKELLNADYDKLTEEFKDIDGVGNNTAFFFKFLKEISVKYSEFKIRDKEKLSSPQDVVEFLKNSIGTCEEEKMYAVFFNASNKVLDFKEISEGTVARSAVYPGKIAREALLTNARSVIVAHNHPGGVCKPSQNDIIATEAVQKALKAVEVILLDHIIVTVSDFYSFKDNGLI